MMTNNNMESGPLEGKGQGGEILLKKKRKEKTGQESRDNHDKPPHLSFWASAGQPKPFPPRERSGPTSDSLMFRFNVAQH